MVALRDLKILLVEDDVSDVLIIKRALRGEPYMKLSVAPDGLAAIASLQSENFDLVVLDLHLPGATGIDVMRWISGNRPKTPVIVLTSDTAEASRDKVLELGAKSLARKPASTEEFEYLVRAMVDLWMRSSTVGSLS